MDCACGAGQSNYEKAISAMNKAVQDGTNLLIDVLPLLPTHTDEGMYERNEFRRLVLLQFRLMCFEVRADIQARSNRTTWLDPNGSICTNQERMTFTRLTRRATKREWKFHHPKNKKTAGHLTNFIGYQMETGRFEVALRPAVVQMWLSEKILRYATGDDVIGACGAQPQQQPDPQMDDATAAAAAVEMTTLHENVSGGCASANMSGSCSSTKGGGRGSFERASGRHMNYGRGQDGDARPAPAQPRLHPQEKSAVAAARARSQGVATHLHGSSALHARLIQSLDTYASNLGVMLNVDRTPLPYVYVQMASVLLCGFVLTLPFALLKVCDCCGCGCEAATACECSVLLL